MNPLIGRLFVAWFACRLLWGLIVHVRGYVYDLRDIRYKQAIKAHPHAKKYRIKPLLTIVVFANNNASTIQQCLTGIIKSSYRKYEILVIDNASTDQTYETVNAFIAAHPKQAITVLKKRKPTLQEAIVNDLNKKLYTGELVLFLDAGSTLDPQALKSAVQNAATTQADVIKLNTRLTLSPLSLAQVTHYFDMLIGSKKRKWGGGLPENLLPQSLMVRRSVLVEISRQVPEGLVYSYAHDATVIRQPAASFEDIFDQFYEVASAEYKVLGSVKRVSKNTVYHWKKRAVIAVKFTAPALDILAFTYLVYLAAVFQNTLLFSVGWLILLAVFGIAVWSDSSLRMTDKGIITLLVPIAYIFLLAAAVTKLTAQTAAGIRYIVIGRKELKSYTKTKLKILTLLKA